MRFSIWPSTTQTWDEILTTARHADDTGWDRVYVADHFMIDGEGASDETLTPVHEATALLSALAASTERIGLAALVLSVTFRHPALIANWASTVDHVSGGRLVLGIGAGWQINEHEQYGIPLGRPGERVDRFDEACRVIAALLAERSVDHEGSYYRLTGAVSEPKPLQAHVPLLIGAKGPRMMGLVARFADEWNTWGLPSLVAERRSLLVEQCERIGRDPAEIAVSCQALWRFDDPSGEADAGPPPVVSGPVDRLVEHVAAWKDVGVDEVIVPDGTLGRGSEKLDRMDAIVEQIAPHFR